MIQIRFATRNPIQINRAHPRPDFLTIFALFILLALPAALFGQATPGTTAKPAAPATKPAAPQTTPATKPPVAAPKPAPVKPPAPAKKPAAARPAPVAKPQAPAAKPAPAAPGALKPGEAATDEEVAPAEEDSGEEESQSESIWVLIRKGGWTMVGLAIISTIILGFSLERWFFFLRAKMDTKGYFRTLNQALESDGLKGAQGIVQGDDRLISRILAPAFAYQKDGIVRFEKSIESAANVEIGKLERGLNLLSNLGNLAPLLGFFGTVVGMRTSFLEFVLKAAPTARDLAQGVEEALITTAAGLLIAIPTYLMYNLFIYSIDKFSIELERCTAAITARIKG